MTKQGDSSLLSVIQMTSCAIHRGHLSHRPPPRDKVELNICPQRCRHERYKVLIGVDESVAMLLECFYGRLLVTVLGLSIVEITPSSSYRLICAQSCSVKLHRRAF